MFSQASKAERTAAEAWDHLSSAMASVGESARQAGSHAVDVTSTTASRLAGQASKKSSKFADQAGDLADLANRRGSRLAGKAGSRGRAAADEAWARASLAADALAGRKPGLPWGLIIGAGLLGAALGWAAASAARVALERQAEAEERELAEAAIVVTPTEQR